MIGRRKEGYAMAVQVTADTFDRPLGKDAGGERIPGTQTSMEHRCIFVATDMGLAAAGVGDWIVRKSDGKLEVFDEEDFEAVYGDKT